MSKSRTVVGGVPDPPGAGVLSGSVGRWLYGGEGGPVSIRATTDGRVMDPGAPAMVSMTDGAQSALRLLATHRAVSDGATRHTEPEGEDIYR